jgi:cytochrome c oxidase cbb3-type subunit IV
MDLDDIRAAITLLSFLLFIGIMVWTWARKRRDGFDEAARLPFVDDGGERP